MMTQQDGNEAPATSFRKIVKLQNQIVVVLQRDGIDLQVQPVVKCQLLVLHNELVVSHINFVTTADSLQLELLYSSNFFITRSLYYSNSP